MPRRQVGLDDARDDVDRRALRRENQVDADGARHLREAADRLLDLLAGHHHQVGQLVDDDDDEGQRLAARLAVRALGVGLLGQRRPHVAVELLDVADAVRRQRLVALLHLAHGPAQRVGGLLGIDDDRREQVRDVLVHAEFEPLRVDHDEAHFVGRGAEEDAADHRVDADRLAGAGRAGDEQVRHGRQVADERLAVNRLAERHRQPRRASGV